MGDVQGHEFHGNQYTETAGLQQGDYARGTAQSPITLADLGENHGPVGPVTVEAFRVGAHADQNDKPLMDGRGLFFADTAAGAKAYAALHEGHEVTRYVISAKNAYLAKNQFTLSQELLGKSFQDATYAEDKKLMKADGGFGNSAKAAANVEVKLMRKLRAKGYDAVVLTDPPAPARREIAVIKKTADVRRANR